MIKISAVWLVLVAANLEPRPSILVPLHGPDSQKIWINPRRVVSVRSPREVGKETLAPGVKCLIEMSNGKFVVVVDECDVVLEAIAPGP